MSSPRVSRIPDSTSQGAKPIAVRAAYLGEKEGEKEGEKGGKMEGEKEV
jgi:hypothetical protein